MKILGFDISSTTIGWCCLLVDDKITLINHGYIKPIKTGTIIERIADTRNKVQDLLEKIEPDQIAIEDIVQFIRGKSTANTVITLASFNRTIGLLSYDYLGKPPGLFSVITIRHGLKIGKKLPSKEDIPELVSKHLNLKYPYIKDKKGKIKIESYDVADSIAVALYYSFILTGKISRKGKK